MFILMRSSRHRATTGVAPIVDRLAHDLGKEYRHQVWQLWRAGEAPDRLKALSATAVATCQTWRAVVSLADQGQAVQLDKAKDRLHELTDTLGPLLRKGLYANPGELEGLARTLHLVVAAEQELYSVSGNVSALKTPKIVAPSDLLFQAYHSLFPAERMLVAAGRKTGDGAITLGALWEVTGAASNGHVRADPARLGEALIGMELSGTHLAAWVHSHPGRSAVATCPSDIDLRQQQSWLRDYSPLLLGITVVADGWIRFWGPALDTRQVSVEVVGGGVTVEEQDGQVFRLQGH